MEKAAEKMMWNPNNNFCTVCKSKISDSEKFRKHIQSSGHLFKTYVVKKSGNADIFSNFMIGYTCPSPSCRKIFTSKVILSYHGRTEHNIRLNKNNLKPDTIIPKNAKKNEDEENQMSEIMIKDEPDKAKAHPCTLCNKTFGFVESLQNHYKRHHKGVFFCIHCEFTTINKTTFSSHLRVHYNLTRFQKLCSTCFKVCDSNVDLLNHRKTYHETKVLPVCTICNSTFMNPTLLKKHKRDVHRTNAEEVQEKKLLRCRKCNRGFLSLLVLEKHQCTAVKYPCVKKCGRRFESFSLMSRHALKCNSGITIYSCKRCSKPLKTLNSLKVHLEKCVLKTSTPTSESTETKIEKKLDEKLRGSGSPLKQHPRTEIDAVLKKNRIDSLENLTDKRMKTSASEEIAHQNPYKCIRCSNAFSSTTDFDQHVKSCTTALTKTLRRLPPKKRTTTTKMKIVAKKPKKSKMKLKVKKASKSTKKKVIKVKKKSTPVVNVSTDNSRKERPTMACEKCGLVFKDVRFLQQHLLTAHSPLEDKISKTTTESHTKQMDNSENRSHMRPSSEVPKCDNATPVWNVKWKQASHSPIDLNITRMRCIETTPKLLDLSTRGHSTPQSAKINEIKERMPKQSDSIVAQPAEIRRPVNILSSTTSKQNNDIDRSTLQSHTTTKDPISSMSSERRFSRWDYPYKTPPSSISKNIELRRMPNQNRYAVNINNPSTSRIRDQNRYSANSNRTPKMLDKNRYSINTNNPSPPVLKSNSPSETPATSTPKLLRPEYLVNQKKNDNLTIIQSSVTICAICKSSEFHLFCNPCCRCFLSNQVQYFNHMKMKHS